jgi:ABC-type multidrug transport system permease subunit
MAWSFFNNIYELFTSTAAPLVIVIVLWALIFVIVYDILYRMANLGKGPSLIAAIAVSVMAVFSGLTTKAMHFILALGGAMAMIIMFVIIVLAFIGFALGSRRFIPRRRR